MEEIGAIMTGHYIRSPLCPKKPFGQPVDDTELQ